MLDGRVRCVECRREDGILLLDAGIDDEALSSAAITLHCTNCDQHFRLSMMACENHVEMGWGSSPCPVDPCPYTEAHKASHES
jgi:hypothetical protein